MRKNDNKGFTFIELILYMAILGIFMVAVVTMITSTVATSRKQNSKRKLQTQATETYDYLSDLLMGATNVKIQGTSSSGKSGVFVAPGNSAYTKADGKSTFSKSPSSDVLTYTGDHSVSYDYYDVASLTPFGGDTVSATADTIDVTGLWLSYAELKDNCYCTLEYDGSKLYISKSYKNTNLDDGDVDDGKDVDDSGNSKYPAVDTTNGTLLAKNVSSFQMQVNPDDDSVALIIKFEDSQNNQEYEVTGVVGFRNSFVMKKQRETD